MGQITATEAISIQVGRFIHEEFRCNGLLWPADTYGVVTQKGQLTDQWGIGILYEGLKHKPRTAWFGLRTIRPRWDFIGVLHFKSNGNCPDSDAKIWRLDAYGRDWELLIQELIAALSQKFGVDIKVKLVDERSRYEARMFDNDPGD